MAVDGVPFEIWLHITEFMPPAEVRSLYGVNHSLFEIAMDARYKVLDLEVYDSSGKIISKLTPLKDPAIAKRVRHLAISGLLLQKCILQTIASPKVISQIEGLANTMAYLKRSLPDLDATTVSSPFVRQLSEILPTLNNVSVYTLVWDFREGMRYGDIIHRSLKTLILDVAWPAFGSLRTLNISALPGRFSAVVSSIVSLDQLEELTLELFRPPTGSQSLGIHDASFPESVARFFAWVNPRLETLSIKFALDFDFSCLFDQLQSFKNLRRLFLQIVLDHDGVIPDSSGLEHFFAHAALELRHLTLSLHYSAISSAHRTVRGLAMACACIPRLETLHIHFGMPRTGLSTTLLAELRSVFNGARHTLHTLVLEGISLNYDDLEAVTSIFADLGALRSVTLGVLTLTPSHIDLLAKNLPSIGTLGVIFSHLSLLPDGPLQPESECREHFKHELQRRKYVEWKLHDISIWHHERSTDTSRWDLVPVLATSAPSVTKYFGLDVSESQSPHSPQELLLLRLFGLDIQ
ncbi:hypothetical protein C8J57DRAFT_120430 [Mycena rebaudengoi]|nr:hypothetical protein C8J57DRAFT_120430 [Mycena rebaudengoi]